MNKTMHRPSAWKQTSILTVLIALTLLTTITFLTFPSSSSRTSSPSSTMASSAAAAAAAGGSVVGEGSIVHIVMFQYQEGTKEEVIRDVNTRMLALKDNCVHPTTKKPYVKMGMGGKQNSPEGMTGDIEYIFVEEFASAADRTYYLEEDPVHLAFVQSLGGGMVKKVQVVDFSPGVF